MVKRTELVNINCPVCGTPIAAAYKGEDVKGALQHKCGQCKRYWSVDYTNKTIVWVKGKEDKTPIKNWQLNLFNGNCLPAYV